MKTENLTWAEAIRAYANGERIRDAFLDEYWLENDKPMFMDESAKKTEIHTTADMSPCFGPFNIVKPEPKSLSFEQAVQCNEVKIYLPEEIDFGVPHAYLSKGCGWSLQAATFLDLAERRGWHAQITGSGPRLRLLRTGTR